MGKYQFPCQNIVCGDKPFSRELLGSLLEKVYAAPQHFAGYMMMVEQDLSLSFLLFFNGSPYAVGRYSGGKTLRCSFRDFGDHIASATDTMVSMTLCETDPVLLKCMMLFFQKDPEIKAPASLINIEQIVRRMADAGDNALIALCRENTINFFYFRDGKGTLAYYSDQTFERPDKMDVDEQMMLYAFQSGAAIHAYVFRDVPGSEEESLAYVDKESLFRILTAGAPKNRRKEDRRNIPASPDNREKTACPTTLPHGINTSAVTDLGQSVATDLKLAISFESGPLQGQTVTLAPPCIMGRKECDLVLDDIHVSRKHARLRIEEHTVFIEDLGSKNGTRVNGEMITTKQLALHDLISVGVSNFRVSAQ